MDGFKHEKHKWKVDAQEVDQATRRPTRTVYACRRKGCSTEWVLVSPGPSPSQPTGCNGE